MTFQEETFFRIFVPSAEISSYTKLTMTIKNNNQLSKQLFLFD